MKPQGIFAGDWLEAIVRAWLLEFGFMANHSPWRNTTVNTGLIADISRWDDHPCRLIFRFFHCEVSSLRTWPKTKSAVMLSFCRSATCRCSLSEVYSHSVVTPAHHSTFGSKKVSLLDGSCFLTERTQPMGWEAHRSDTGIGIWSN